jgi:hypothetical protein
MSCLVPAESVIWRMASRAAQFIIESSYLLLNEVGMETVIRTNPLFARFTRIAAEINEPTAWMSAQRDGERLLLLTGPRMMRRTRHFGRLAGVVCMIAGAAIATATPWGWPVAAAGVLGFIILPRLVRTTTLLEIDGAREMLIVRMPAAGAGVLVPIAPIAEIRGLYETQGWDSRSAVYAALHGGEVTPLLAFSGTDEHLAEYACRMIGALIDRTATYEGPFGAVKTCYAQQATAHQIV